MNLRSILLKLKKTKVGSNIIALFVLGIIFSVFTKGFLKATNIIDIFRDSSFMGMAVLGETLVMIGGGIDISIGGIACLSAIVAASLMQVIPLPLAVLIGVMIGLLCGLINGLLITKFNITPLIVTLGTMSIFFGMVSVLTKGVPIFSISAAWTDLATTRFIYIPIPVIVFIFISILLSYFLKNIYLGRNLYAVGGNTEAAMIAGISIKKTKIYMYVMSGVLSAIGGLMALSWIGSGQPTLGRDWLMKIIAASIIGGTTLSGGKGSIAGAITGILILGFVSNGLTLLRVSPYWKGAFVGLILILAVLLDVLSRKNSN